jgi:hypothetical protein
MSPSKKAIGKRFGLLTALVAALLIGCTGAVLAQSSSAYPDYENPNPVTPSDSTHAGAGPVTGSSSGDGDVSLASTVGPNGGFENGNFKGWTRANQSGGSGNWFVYSGTKSPLSDFNIAAPPDGRFAATTDQTGPGSHVLYRNIHLKRGMKHKLSFYLYYRNRAERFFTPNTLDYTVDPNQQYRVDLLRPTANPFTVNPDAILKRLFRTEVGDPNSLRPTLMTFDLTPYAGKTVRLRFAEVDNQLFFQASVDKVRVKSTKR